MHSDPPVEHVDTAEREPDQPKWTRLLLAPVRVADLLNEQFLSLARGADNLMRKAERTLSRKPAREPAPTDTSADEERDTNELARWARVRLSELHLRVGQSIYRLESGGTETEPVKRQLFALLEEIERLEDILRAAGGVIEDSIPEDLKEIESLVASLEVETERSES